MHPRIHGSMHPGIHGSIQKKRTIVGHKVTMQELAMAKAKGKDGHTSLSFFRLVRSVMPMQVFYKAAKSKSLDLASKECMEAPCDEIVEVDSAAPQIEILLMVLLFRV